MKVVQQTVTLLTLKERPIGVWILSGLTAAIGLLIFLSSNSSIDWFGLVCIGLANGMMFGSPVKACQFDKQSNLVMFKQQGWLGSKVIRRPIDQVTEVQVEQLNLFGLKLYRLRLVLFSGALFYLTPIPSTDCRLQQHLARTIKQFLA
ncbi:MAG: hypothetical protein RID53_23340 [Coleofasciculus sp. B1-GNL1-01]|uniref:hypothetical protein n=1 Tax=Coleofasciculus sp. B1-GNL1-01 TaxID=3068484 RepID=UPI0032FD648A